MRWLFKCLFMLLCGQSICSIRYHIKSLSYPFNFNHCCTLTNLVLAKWRLALVVHITAALTFVYLKQQCHYQHFIFSVEGLKTSCGSRNKVNWEKDNAIMPNNTPESLKSHCMSDKYKYEDTDPETGEVLFISSLKSLQLIHKDEHVQNFSDWDIRVASPTSVKSSSGSVFLLGSKLPNPLRYLG